MSYEVKRDEQGRVVVYKDGKMLGVVNTMGDDTKKEPLLNVLLGTADGKELKTAQKLIGKNCAVAMKLCFRKEREEEIENFLEDYLGDGETLVKIGGGELAIIKTLAPGEDLSAPRVYAEILSQSVLEEIGEKVFIGIGSFASFAEDLSKSYAQAERALKKTGDGCVFSHSAEVFGEVLRGLSKEKASEFLGEILPSSALEIFNSEELFLTAQTFLSCNLNLSETARKLYLHRNTLSYRLNRIERVTGLDIKKFSDALAFKCATELYEIVKKR